MKQDYQKTVEKKRRKYGADTFRRWGMEGGSPILLRYAEQQRKRESKRHGR
jgi:hypothetical protein